MRETARVVGMLALFGWAILSAGRASRADDLQNKAVSGDSAALNANGFGNFGAFTGNVPPNVAPLVANAGLSYRFNHWRWPLEIGGSMRYVGNRFLEQDNLTILNAYTTADVYAFLDIPGRDVAMPELENVRISMRVRNLTNAIYAAWSDTTYPDQILLGAPRTYEVGASARW